MGGARRSAHNKDHVLIFPFMAKGHTIPLLHLSSVLSRRGLKVTLLTTPVSSPFFHRFLHLPKPNIHLIHLPFPTTTTLPPGCESTDNLPTIELLFAFLQATRIMEEPFRRLLEDMANSDDIPLCVVSDFFFGWTRPICENEYGIPRLVFHGTGVFPMAIQKAFSFAQRYDNADNYYVPGTPDNLRIKLQDMPYFDPKVFDMIKDDVVEESNSWGTVVNSFTQMDSSYVALLESFYRKGSRAWLVGPLSLYSCDGPYGTPESTSSEVLRWLDGKSLASVVYVSFGTQAEISDVQLDEVARGLLMSGCDFVWVVRSRTWAPPAEIVTCLRGEGEGKERGMLCREMVPQREVLAHAATGGFVSHCGWNSVLESVSGGVPILAWPMINISEQGLNAKYVVDVIDVGLRIKKSDGDDVVSREDVCEGVRELMEGEIGKRARERVKELAKEAKVAVEEGGSSSETMDELLHQLRSVQ